MALILGDNFSYQGAKPLDGRLNYPDLATMKAVADATMYEGCLGYCLATEKTYQWKSTNTVDETLGKWREFESGGGVTDYPDLTNKPSINNVELVGNKTSSDLGLASLNDFVKAYRTDDASITGAALRDQDYFPLYDASDAHTKKILWQHIVAVLNGLYQFNDDKMTASDMDEIFSTLPSKQKSGHNYSTAEQVIGTWIDGSTIYEKTFQCTTPSTLDSYTTLTTISNLSKCLSITGYSFDNGGNFHPVMTNRYMALLCKTTGEIRCVITSNNEFLNKTIYITVQYTKS